MRTVAVFVLLVNAVTASWHGNHTDVAIFVAAMMVIVCLPKENKP